MNTTTPQTLKTEGKWEKHNDQFVAVFRFAGDRGDVARHVGKFAWVKAKSGRRECVTLTALVKDYGDGDVTLYSVSRE